jgi:hypothetical protein
MGSQRGDMRCAHMSCEFLVHPDVSFGGFCCKKCHSTFEQGLESDHGGKCQREKARHSAVRAVADAPAVPLAQVLSHRAARILLREAAAEKPAPELPRAAAPALRGSVVVPKPKPPAPALRGSIGGVVPKCKQPSHPPPPPPLQQAPRTRTLAVWKTRREQFSSPSPPPGFIRCLSRGTQKVYLACRVCSGTMWPSDVPEPGNESPLTCGICGPERENDKPQTGPSSSSSESPGTTSKCSAAPPLSKHISRSRCRSGSPSRSRSRSHSRSVKMFEEGDTVQLAGLDRKNPEMNGQLAKIVLVSNRAGCKLYDVKITQGTRKGTLRRIGGRYLRTVPSQKSSRVYL